MLKAKLIVVGGDTKIGEVNLDLPSTVGRGREASITLAHPLVSRMHCEFYEKQGKLFIKDLESMNGTFIDNHRITGEHVIEPKQLLTIGNVTFRALYEYQANSENCQPEVPANSAESLDSLETQLAPCEKETVIDPKNSVDHLSGETVLID